MCQPVAFSSAKLLTEKLQERDNGNFIVQIVMLIRSIIKMQITAFALVHFDMNFG